MKLEIWLNCVARLRSHRDDDTKRLQHAEFVYEGGTINITAPLGTFNRNEWGKVYQFQVPTQIAFINAQGKNGTFQIPAFKPDYSNGVYSLTKLEE